MKRLLLSCCILLCVVLTLKAQEQPLISPDDSIRSLVGRLFPNSNPNLSAHMNLQFSTSGVANFIEGDLEDASFKLNRVKLEILGSFSKQFSYHFRQSFNKYSNPHSLDNLSSSIEYALVNWKMSDKFTLTAGKQDIALGGYLRSSAKNRLICRPPHRTHSGRHPPDLGRARIWQSTPAQAQHPQSCRRAKE